MRILAVIALLLAPAAAQAQTSTAFEVASVKPSTSGPVRVESDPSRLTIRAQSLDVLVELAFGLREYQYQGPAWMHAARYDIVATTGSPQPRAVQLAMLRALLADRFKIKLHHETKSLPVYLLIVGKNGSKLKPMDEKLPAPFELYYNFSMAPTSNGATELRGYGSLGQFSDFLTRVAGRPVLDRTGIGGNFDLRLLCAIDGFPGEDTSPSVFDAIQAQMGLKLEAAVSPVEITVVDHAEKPSVN